MKKQLNLYSLTAAAMLIANVAVAETAGTQTTGVAAKNTDDTITVTLPNLKKTVEQAKIKISAGYEYTDFDGGQRNENANAFRLQLQATF